MTVAQLFSCLQRVANEEIEKFFGFHVKTLVTSPFSAGRPRTTQHQLQPKYLATRSFPALASEPIHHNVREPTASGPDVRLQEPEQADLCNQKQSKPAFRMGQRPRPKGHAFSFHRQR